MIGSKNFIKNITLLLLLLLNFSICFAGVDFTDGVANDGGYITVSDSSSLDIDGEAFSFSVWIKPNFTETLTRHTYIFDKMAASSSAYRFLFNANIYDFRFRLDTADGVVNCNTTDLSWTANTWHHLAGTYDGSQMEIFWDGTSENTANQTGNVTTNNDIFTIGVRNNATGGFFNGQINELAIWEGTLTSQDIANLYNSKVKRMPLQIQPANLRAYWSLDDVADEADAVGATFMDMSGNGNTGTGAQSQSGYGLTGKAEEILSYPE